MKLSRRATRVVAIGVVAATIGVAAVTRAHKPVLVHLFGADDCACGELYEKTTGLTVWNPWRDRSPELVANDFFAKLKANRCDASRDLCNHALPSHRGSDWRLKYREDTGGSVSLYFNLTKYGASDPRYGLTGHGAVDLQKGTGGWTVAGYDSYF
jgi:hypothetical protein